MASPNLVEDKKNTRIAIERYQIKETVHCLKGVIHPITMAQTELMTEMLNKDDTESETTEVWEAQWNDFGALPQIPEFNVALAEFIVQQAGTKTSFPEILHQVGGI
jgi:hypothetical protein